MWKLLGYPAYREVTLSDNSYHSSFTVPRDGSQRVVLTSVSVCQNNADNVFLIAVFKGAGIVFIRFADMSGV